jgi:hypothetical protein
MNFKDFNDKHGRFLIGQCLVGLTNNQEVDHSDITRKIIEQDRYLMSLADYSDMSNLSEDKIKWIDKKPQLKAITTLLIIDLIKEINQKLTIKQSNRILQQNDSYNRPEIMLSLHDVMIKSDWVECLFKFWKRFDGCSLYTEEFKALLKDIDYQEVMKLHFDEDNFQQWSNLEEKVCVYRGAFESDKAGISWTTDLSIAQDFANLYISVKNRDLQHFRIKSQILDSGLERLNKRINDRVSIFITVVDKKDCILINNDGESEVFILNADKYKISDLICG